MTDITRHSAESLFRRPAAEGSNAAKLEEVRARQTLRSRERKPAERQERLERRTQSSGDGVFSKKEPAHADV
jgi:hypothetical protein